MIGRIRERACPRPPGRPWGARPQAPRGALTPWWGSP